MEHEERAKSSRARDYYQYSPACMLLLPKHLPESFHRKFLRCWVNHKTMDVHVVCGRVGIELTDPRTGFPSSKLITQLLLVL